ncbi:hypothetical protein KR018_003437, partial [Drosophila ironensis]
IMLLHGTTVGWFTPTYAYLASDKSPFDKPLTIEDASWIGSMMGLGGMSCNLFIGIIMQRFGRKPVLICAAVPQIINWILIYFGNNVIYLYVARFLVGLSGGCAFVCLPVFLSEICDENLRGTLTSSVILNLCTGMLLGFLLGSYVPYKVLPCIIIIVPIVYLILIYFLPESPMFLLQTGKPEKAEESFNYYKNGSPDDPKIKAEFKIIQQECEALGIDQGPTCSDYCNPYSCFVYGLILTLILGHQMSGNFAMLVYAMPIFKQLGAELDIYVSVILLGVAQLLGVLVATIVVDRLGRRFLLLTTLLGMFLGECVIAGLKTFASKEFLEKNGWIGVATLFFIIFICSCGVNPVTFIAIVELLPVKILSLGTALSMATLNFTIFVALKIYPLELEHWGLSITMLISAGFCAVCAIILACLMPETRNKRMSV